MESRSPWTALRARTVNKLPVVPGRLLEYFDSLPGFAVRVSPSGHRSNVLTYSAEYGSNRRATIGRVERRCFEVAPRICAWAVWKGYLEESPFVAAIPLARQRGGSGLPGAQRHTRTSS